MTKNAKLKLSIFVEKVSQNRWNSMSSRLRKTCFRLILPRNFEISFFRFLFGHLSVRFSLLNHHISSPGTSENHRKTCGERSWRYGYAPVHIAYPSTRNTSENRRSFFPKIWYFFTNCPENSFAWNGFSDLIQDISQMRSENHFRQINLP